MHRASFAIAAFLVVHAANAAIVVETELPNTATDNTVATAQTIPGASFTIPGPPTVFVPTWPTATVLGTGGGNDVDFYAFASGAGGAHFDIDGAAFDTILTLFNSAGTVIAYGDDSAPADAGSASTADSFIGTIDLAAGNYFVTVTRFNNFAEGTFAPGTSRPPLTRPDGFSGGFLVSGAPTGNSAFVASGNDAGLAYTLHISLENAAVIPEPESSALLLAGLGLLGFAARRRRLHA
jgi:hypothetical protein